MAYKLVGATKEEAYEIFKTQTIGLYVYADYWEMPSAMFFKVKSYEPGFLTPENYSEIVLNDCDDNHHECEELDQKLGYPISQMFLGYFNEEEDFVIIQFKYEED